MHISTQAPTYIHTHTCIYTHAYAYTHRHAHAYGYAYTHAYVIMRTHTHTHNIHCTMKQKKQFRCILHLSSWFLSFHTVLILYIQLLNILKNLVSRFRQGSQSSGDEWGTIRDTSVTWKKRRYVHTNIKNAKKRETIFS